MKNKVVLVTGASSGLGKTIAQFLSKQGYKVYGTSRSGNQEIEGVSMLTMDVTAPDKIEAAIRQIIHSENRLDILINNAGIGMAGALEDSDYRDFANVIHTNLLGPFAVIKSVLPQMRKQRNGLIINVSSLGGIFGLPFRSAYCASKAALDSLSESLRMEVKTFGIKVCSIQPGDIKTNIGDHRIVNVNDHSAYKAAFGRCYKIINNDVHHALEAQFFAEKVSRIINSSKTKRAYILGKPMQKVTVLLKRVLPDYLFEKIIMNYYKV